MTDLFTYGTLMDRAVLERELAREVSADPVPATLRGFRRVQCERRGYPWITEDASGVVEGMLWRGLDSDDLERLDRYEGIDQDPPEYTREQLIVRTRSGREILAEVYVGVPQVFEADP